MIRRTRAFLCLAVFQMSSSAGKFLSGKTFLVTGSTDGIGLHTATRLVGDGAGVILHGRKAERVRASKEKILQKWPDARLTAYVYDLSDMTAVKSFCREVLTNHEELHGVINNAGVFEEDYHRTNSDGLEMTFAVNVVAPYMIACLLLPLLRRTPLSKILNVSSISQGGRIQPGNLQLNEDNYSAHAAYSLSKLYMAAFSHELSRRITAEEALVLSCDPGTVNTKMLDAGWGMCGIRIDLANDEYKLMTSAFDASSHGKYYVSCRESRCDPDLYNDALRVALWHELERITGTLLI